MPRLRKSISLPMPKGKNNFPLHLLASYSSSGTDVNTFFHASHGVSVAGPTHALASEAADDAKTTFHESLPPSLLAETSYHEQDCVAPFNWEECALGPLLGSGKFSDVYEIKSFRFENRHVQSTSVKDINMSAEQLDQRLHMKNQEKYRQTNKARYALKLIRPKHLETHQGRMMYIQSASDLALEKEFLSSLVHPHIIKLRGVTHSGPTGCAIIIDRLVDTLDQRMRSWRNPSRSKRAGTSKLSRSMINLSSSFTSKAKAGRKVEGKSKELDHRLSVALQIAAAMKYLHSHCIIYRDLKPTNIGFDVRGDVKVFDFGLARFCPEDGDPNNEVFNMSGAGSPRYMAPECLRGGAYNMKADVYSFAIVLWEILSGQTPHVFARRRHHLVDYVVKEHGRPDIDPCWPDDIQSMLESSFDVDIGMRPEMKHFYNGIREVLVSLRGGERSELDDSWISRRRSAVSADK